MTKRVRAFSYDDRIKVLRREGEKLSEAFVEAGFLAKESPDPATRTKMQNLMGKLNHRAAEVSLEMSTLRHRARKALANRH